MGIEVWYLIYKVYLYYIRTNASTLKRVNTHILKNDINVTLDNHDQWNLHFTEKASTNLHIWPLVTSSIGYVWLADFSLYG